MVPCCRVIHEQKLVNQFIGAIFKTVFLLNQHVQSLAASWEVLISKCSILSPSIDSVHHYAFDRVCKAEPTNEVNMIPKISHFQGIPQVVLALVFLCFTYKKL